MLLHEKQRHVVRSPARFKVIRAGRRSGKTTVETEIMAFKAVSKSDRSIFYIAPTQIQARDIIWNSLKARLAGIGDAHEQRLEMRVPAKGGGFSLIKVAGWENRENFRGKPADHITFDETDTLKDFFIGWQEIFRPALIDRRGTADFIGTPKKENPNLRRLEKEFAGKGEDFEAFHFTSVDNPHLDPREIEAARRDLDPQTFRQEILAEYVENEGALFHYDALVDVFTNTVDKGRDRYLAVDVADDGSDKTVFSFWEGMEEYKRERFARLNTEDIINKIREYASAERIPFSHIIVDAIGVGAGVASSSLLTGVVGFKSSYAPIKTDQSIVLLPNVHYSKHAPLTSEYKNLRSQCIFTLAWHVNEHKIASRVTDRSREYTIEELSHYQDASRGDGKRMATPKEDVRELIGRSPDDSDTWIMRMYFTLKDKLLPSGEEVARTVEQQNVVFDRAFHSQQQNSGE